MASATLRIMIDRLTSTKELAALIEGMDVPSMRRDIAWEHNLMWLRRNIRFNNQGSDVDRALELIGTLLAE